MTEHELEYVDANTSYCHTCKRQVPNAHVPFHEDMVEIESRVDDKDRPNQENAPIPDEDVITLEAIGEMMVEEWLGAGRQFKVLSSGLAGQGADDIYSVGVRFEGYLTGPFSHKQGENYRAYLGMICEDNRVIVKVDYDESSSAK